VKGRGLYHDKKERARGKKVASRRGRSAGGISLVKKKGGLPKGKEKRVQMQGRPDGEGK